MTTGYRVLGHRASFIPGRHHCSVRAFVVSVLNLPDDVENFANISALVVGAAEARQKNVLKRRVLEEISILMGPTGSCWQVARMRGTLRHRTERMKGQCGAKPSSDHSEAKLFSC